MCAQKNVGKLAKYYVLTTMTGGTVLLLVLVRLCVEEQHCWLWL